MSTFYQPYNEFRFQSISASSSYIAVLHKRIEKLRVLDSVYVMVYQQSNPQVYYSLSLGNFSDVSGLSVELFKTE